MASDDELRHRAIKRIRAKQSVQIHLSVYIVVNLLLVAIWFFTSRDYFWPIWPFLGWSIGLFFHWFGVSRRWELTEHSIQAEMDRLRGTSKGGDG